MRRQHAIVHCRGQCRSAALVTAIIDLATEVEHVEQIADGRAVPWYIGVVSIGARVRQIVAAAAGQWLETPIPFDKLQDRDVIIVAVHHMSARRIGRHYDEWDARSVAKEI